MGGRRAMEELADLIAPELLNQYGRVFYSGSDAFSAKAPVPIYILGLNPGGHADGPSAQTVAQNNRDIMAKDYWSAYFDESWEGRPPGTHGMQPRVRSMFRNLGIDLRRTPASNLIFLGAPQEQHLIANQMMVYEEGCWNFHRAVIERLKPKLVLCFGNTAAARVIARLRQDAAGQWKGREPRVVDSFVETNGRGWTSSAWELPSGPMVVRATHPSRANWCEPSADPTPLVQRMLERTA